MVAPASRISSQIAAQKLGSTVEPVNYRDFKPELIELFGEEATSPEVDDQSHDQKCGATVRSDREEVVNLNKGSNV